MCEFTQTDPKDLVSEDNTDQEPKKKEAFPNNHSRGFLTVPNVIK